MLALEVTNMQTGVWKRQDGRLCESRTEWGNKMNTANLANLLGNGAC